MWLNAAWDLNCFTVTVIEIDARFRIHWLCRLTRDRLPEDRRNRISDEQGIVWQIRRHTLPSETNPVTE